MNEEEKIKDIIEILELSKEEIEGNNENITAILDLQDLKSLKNLLDLYNKEKEKNKELGYSLKHNVVTKYKIRHKIKKLKKEYEEYKDRQEWATQDNLQAQIEVLQELLGG